MRGDCHFLEWLSPFELLRPTVAAKNRSDKNSAARYNRLIPRLKIRKLLMPNARKDAVAWLPGHYYHLYNRGARQKTIFPDKETYYFALRRIQEYSQLFAVTVIAYCLLPNHYHFLVRRMAKLQQVNSTTGFQ